MRFLVVDDDLMVLKQLEMLIRKAAPDDGVDAVANAPEALKLIQKNTYDGAFLDIEMPEMNGLVLAKEIRKVCSGMPIVFITGNEQYALDAYKLHFEGYMLKPATLEKIEKELSYIKDKAGKSNIKIVTFGGFDLIVGDELIKFKRGKAKELLALLVDKRGASINAGTACAELWPESIDDDSLKSNFRNIVASLRKTLEEAGASEIFIKGQNSYSIDVEKVDCDLYSFLDGDTLIINQYSGEYMPEYEWAEMTAIHLDDLSERFHEINEEEERKLYQLNERRKAVRVDYESACDIKIKADEDIYYKGKTINISTLGTYVVVNEEIPDYSGKEVGIFSEAIIVHGEIIRMKYENGCSYLSIKATPFTKSQRERF